MYGWCIYTLSGLWIHTLSTLKTLPSSLLYTQSYTLNRVKHKLTNIMGFSVVPASPLKKVISHVQFLLQEECMIVNNGHCDVIYGVNWSQWHEDYLTIWKAGQLTTFPSLFWGYWPSLKEFLGPSQDTCYFLKVSRRQSDNKLFLRKESD